VDQVPEARAAHGVEHQVHARLGGIVDHAVLPPGIEDPALAGRHVDGLATAFEAHGRLGHDGHVHAHALGPVVALVGVALDFRLSGQAHQPAASHGGADAREYLAQVRTTLQILGGAHGAGVALVV